MLALFLFTFSVFSNEEQSKIYINGYMSSRFDQQVSNHFTVEIDNSKSNFLVILFHSFPGPFSLTSYTEDGEFTTTIFIKNEDSMKYYYIFKPTDKLVVIEPDENELLSFSTFSSSVGCENEDDYFITSKPNQTLVFKNDASVSSFYKINSKSSKCILVDSGGTMEMSINSDKERIQTYLNHLQNSDAKLMEEYSIPLFYTFITSDLNSNDKIEISYKSNFAYKHLFQSGDVISKTPEKKAGVIRVDLTVAIISGLFLVFILMTIIGLRRMRRLADAPSEEEGQTNDQLSVYEPDTNEIIEAKDQYPRKFSEDEYSLSEESDNNVKEIVFYPPKDVFNMEKNSTEIVEESDQNESEEDHSSSFDEENPYNHDAATTL